MKRQCVCGVSHIFDRKVKTINGQVVRCEACFPYPIVSELPRSRSVAERYIRIFGGRLLTVDAHNEVYILNRYDTVVGRVLVGMWQDVAEIRDPNEVGPVPSLERMYSDFSEPIYE